jgi:RimJ/RimL family protein N-acetyltransferase
MAQTRMTADLYRSLQFYNSIMYLPESVGMKAVGLERDGKMVAAAIYEGFNSQNVWVHLAAEPGARWMTREYLRYCFHYPFNEMGVKRLSGYVNASNTQARKLNEHFGYQQEAVLRGAAPDGGDVILYVMWRTDCRFLGD